MVRCYQETGVVDPNCADTVRNAHAAGLKVDVYFFPSVHIGANGARPVCIWCGVCAVLARAV